MAKVQNQQINKQKTPVILKLITTITFNCIAQTKEEEKNKGKNTRERQCKKWIGFWWPHIFKAHTYAVLGDAYARGIQKESHINFLVLDKLVPRVNIGW